MQAEQDLVYACHIFSVLRNQNPQTIIQSLFEEKQINRVSLGTLDAGSVSDFSLFSLDAPIPSNHTQPPSCLVFTTV